jgi:galactokinase
MTGAGFGGCAVALIDAAQADDFVRQTAAGYEKQTRHIPAVYVCTATNGAEVM